MRRIAVVTFSLLLITSVAFGSGRYELVTVAGDKVVYYDTNETSTKWGIVDTWITFDGEDERIVAHVQFKVGEKKQMILSEYKYNTKGEAVSIRQYPYAQWEEYAPNTTSYHVYNKIRKDSDK